jgi:hypothetical protein
MKNETKKGGRGKCCYCKKMENNVSYHEAWECDKNPSLKKMLHIDE